MWPVTLYIIIGVVVVIGLWQLVVWFFETRDKDKKYKAAVKRALENKKPLLVVGGPWGCRPVTRHFFKKPAHGGGDVCLDINAEALTGHPAPVVASVTDIPFADNTFGAVFISHVMEHLPTVAAAEKALNEMNRVADAVYIVYPSRQSIPGWMIRDHHLWVWQKGTKTFVRQRGSMGGVKNIVVETAG